MDLWTMQTLWRSALVLVPIAASVWLLCRVLPLRPTTRHGLWAAVLGLMLIAPLAPHVPLRAWAVAGAGAGVRAWERTAAAAERVWSSSRLRAVERVAVDPDPMSRPAELTSKQPRPMPAEQRPPALRFSTPSDRPSIESRPSLATREARRSELPGSAPAQSTLADRPAIRVQPAARTAPSVAIGRDPLRRWDVSLAPRPDTAEPPRVSGIDATAGAPSGPERKAARLAWGEFLGRIVGAVEALPSVPRTVWSAGAAVIVLLLAVQVLVCRLRLRGSFDAPAGVQGMIAEAARELGLRRAPRVVMVSNRVSPMIWCGVRTRLVLPAELWDELDELGRRAVVHHELAHLKRRDHWLCWVELGACILYWWHPLVWWVRRRVREEADLCCDAWVIALMPRQRRAYADALLSTQKFLGGTRVRPPATGLGVMSGGAKRFARRLTMVMTHRSRPQRSLAGMALAILVGAAGMTSAALACPPDEEQEKQAAHRAQIELRQTRPSIPAPPRAPKPPRAAKAPKAPRARVIAPESVRIEGLPEGRISVVTPRALDEEDVSTFERHMQGRGQAPARAAVPRGEGGGDTDARLEQLERRMDRMEQRIDRVLERLERRGDAGGETRAWIAGTPGAFGVQGRGETIIRSYTLPESVSGAMGELMIREDVPVLVSPGHRAIEVHGDEGQHRVFRNMVDVLTSDAHGDDHEVRVFRVEPGKREAVLEVLKKGKLRAKSAGEDIEVIADGRALTAIDEFVRIIDGHHGEHVAHEAHGEHRAEEAAQHAAEAYAQVERARSMAAHERRQVERRAREADLAALRAAARDQGAASKQAAEALRTQARDMTRRSQELRKELEASARELDRKSGPEREALEARLEQLQARLEAMQEAAEELEGRADEIAEQIEEALSEAMEELEASLEELEALDLGEVDEAIDAVEEPVSMLEPALPASPCAAPCPTPAAAPAPPPPASTAAAPAAPAPPAPPAPGN